MLNLYDDLKKDRDEWFQIAVERGSALSILVHAVKFHQKFGGELETIYKFIDEIIREENTNKLQLKFNVNFGGKRNDSQS